MAEDQDKQEEKFDFTAEGEAIGYISLAQARLLAMQTARETPGDYGERFSGVPMVFAIVAAEGDDDYYRVILDSRLSGDFTGKPGREQFFISKEGEVALRQILSVPSFRSRLPLPAIIAGVALVIGAVAIAVVIAVGGGTKSPDVTSPAPTEIPVVVSLPTDTPVPTPVPTSTASPTATPTPTPLPTPTITQLPTPTPTALPTPTTVPTYTPLRTYTPPPTATPRPTFTPFPTATPRSTFTPVPPPTPRVIVVTATPRPTSTRTPTPVPQPTPNANVYYNKGEDLYKAEQYLAAVDQFKVAIQINPRFRNTYWFRGNAYRKLGQFQRAIQSYDEAISIDPQVSNLYYTRGGSYYQLADYHQAIQNYSQAINLNPQSAGPYNWRGSAYNALGQTQQAKADKDKACQLDNQYCTTDTVIPTPTPPRPAVFGGSATLNGVSAANGTTVTAVIDGVVATTTTVTGGNYAFSIAQPSGSSCKGKTIRFTLGGFIANQVATWTADGGGIVNLTAG